MNDFIKFDDQNKVIILSQSPEYLDQFRAVMQWARENKDTYLVFNAGILKYTNEQAKSLFLIKWT